jgi:hypothetical protein
MNDKLKYAIMHALMILVGAKLVWDGLIGLGGL